MIRNWKTSLVRVKSSLPTVAWIKSSNAQVLTATYFGRLTAKSSLKVISTASFAFTIINGKARVNPVMHMEHKAGDKLYVNFAGEKISFTDKQSGEIAEVEVFVAILGCSQLTYVEAVLTQQKEDFIAACENILHYIGGVPGAIVPDNLKAAVIKSNRYEPTLNETFADFADHYGTAILPARAYHPKDKALVEGAVKIIYARIYEPLRKTIYHSLSELNTSVREVLEVH